MGNTANHPHWDIIQIERVTIRGRSELTTPEQISDSLRIIHKAIQSISTPDKIFHSLPIENGIREILGVLREFPLDTSIQGLGCDVLDVLCSAELRCYLSAISILASNGGMQIIAAAMQRHQHQFSILLCGCSLLEKLLRQDNELAEALVSGGGLYVIVEYMKREPEAGFAAGCHVLVQLARNKQVAQWIAEERVIVAIFEIMREHPNNPSLQDAGCKAILALTNTVQTMYSCYVTRVVVGYATVKFKRLFVPSMVILVKLARDEQLAEMIAQKDIIGDIVEFMQEYPSITLQNAGCEALGKLAVASHKTGQAIAKSPGAIRVILTYMAKRDEEQRAFATGCCALKEFARSEQIAQRIVEERVVVAILAIMREDLNNLSKQDDGCGVFSALAKTSQTIARSVIRDIVGYMKQYPEERFATGCRALVWLATDESPAQMITEEKAVDAILAIMQDHQSDHSIQDTGRRELCEMARKNESLNVMGDILAYMQREPQKRFKTGCYALIQLARMDGTLFSEILESGIDAIVAIMVQHLSITSVKTAGCEFMLSLAETSWITAAEQVSLSAALNVLASTYQGASGQLKDEVKAVELFRTASALGNLDAKFNLALCCEKGCNGQEQNKYEAKLLYEEAARQGHVNSMYNLAFWYQHGFGVREDQDVAIHWYKEVAKTGDLDAIIALITCYEEELDEGRNNKRKVDDLLDSLAKQVSLQGASTRFIQSIFSLGFCYLDGTGVDRNIERARKLFQLGVVYGHLESFFALGLTCKPNTLSEKQQCTVRELLTSEGCQSAGTIIQDWRKWGPQDSPQASTAEASNEPFLKRPSGGSSDAAFLLAELLASTSKVENLTLAKGLVNKASGQQGNSSQHPLSKWLRVLVNDEDFELSSQFNLPNDRAFDAEQDVLPLGLIGKGQFGKVYLSWLRSEQRMVAVKYVDINLPDEDESLARNVIREQLASRVLAQNQVEDVHTAQYLGYTDLVTGGKRGLVFDVCADISEILQYARGLKEPANLPLEKLPDWTSQVRSSLRCSVVFAPPATWCARKKVTMLRLAADAIRHLHKLGFIHRDIAPRNILCDSGGRIQLADFGFAKYVGSLHDDATLLARYRKQYFTPGHQYALAWWAPECFGSEESGVDAVFSWNSDIYAFGITMWQCFSHRDPYSHIVTTVGHEEEAAKEIERLIVHGNRPSLDRWSTLDRDTPKELIDLIDTCWRTDPEKRPTVIDVIEELGKIEQTPMNHVLPDKIGFKGNEHDHWFDVARIYQCKKRWRAGDDVASGGSFCDELTTKQLRDVRHKNIPCTDRVPRRLLSALQNTPYDVFLVHAGEHKELVDVMKELFQEGNLRCFLDSDMSVGCDPTTSMRLALQTCRYVVVVLSEEFFTKKHPAAELMYAYDRMIHIREQGRTHSWDSLRIVLYNLTIDEYKRRLATSDTKLPETIFDNATAREWQSRRQNTRWWHECLQLKATLIEHDEQCDAIAKWIAYLEKTVSENLDGFPSVDSLYR